MSAIIKSESVGLDVAGELPALFQLAKALSKAGGFLPPHLRNEGEITAVILAGRELGIPPMASVRGIKLVKGNVTLDASLQLGCMMRAGGTIQWVRDGSEGVAEAVFRRPGMPEYVGRYTLEMAKRAGLTGDNWSKHPAAMLRARVVTAAGKAYFPDVLAGVYLPDEIEDAPVKQMPARRTLDDVAAPAAAPEPAPHDEHGEVIAAEHEPTEQLDEYGIAIPPYSCPIFQSGPDAGRTYADVPAGKLRALLSNKRFAESATGPQRAWAEYLVERHEREKTEIALDGRDAEQS